MPELCRHKRAVCSECIIVTDAAKRMSDQINAHLTFNKPHEIRSKWIVFKLRDGSTDGAIYDSREQAISHQLDSKWCLFLSFRSLLGGSSAKDCQILLDAHRLLAESGARLHEPEAPQLIMGTKHYDALRYHG
jgi:hypothetical protein